MLAYKKANLEMPHWNDFMELGAKAWLTFCHEIYTLLAEGHVHQEITKTCLLALSDALLHPNRRALLSNTMSGVSNFVAGAYIR